MGKNTLKIWAIFLTSILRNTFDEFLTNSQIDERVSWMIENLYKIDANILYKNVVYLMNNNPISKIIVGYKLHFLLDKDYKEIFLNPQTEEIDLNSEISTEKKKLLNRIIHTFSIVVNNHIDKIIRDKKKLDMILDEYEKGNIIDEITNISVSIDQISDHMKMDKYFELKKFRIVENHIEYHLTLNQCLYLAVYDRNPFTGDKPDENIVNYIKNHYSDRYQMASCLKQKWNSIDLDYTQSSKIFC